MMWDYQPSNWTIQCSSRCCRTGWCGDFMYKNIMAVFTTLAM